MVTEYTLLVGAAPSLSDWFGSAVLLIVFGILLVLALKTAKRELRTTQEMARPHGLTLGNLLAGARPDGGPRRADAAFSGDAAFRDESEGGFSDKELHDFLSGVEEVISTQEPAWQMPQRSPRKGLASDK